MKKTIILILVLLPIVLISVISAAGKVISLITHISVEGVSFIDRVGSDYTADLEFKVPQGGTRETKIRIYPELSTDQTVSYHSSDPSVCTVDENGVITGVHWGSATVTVKTRDGSKTATLNVRVTADIPYAVTLSHDEISMFVGGSFSKLVENVDAPVSLDKSVRWSSSDASVVEVDEILGTVVARAPGEAFVTATTVSGGKTASCKVNVSDDAPFRFDFSGMEGFEDRSEGSELKYIVRLREFDLAQAIRLGQGISQESIRLATDSNAASVSGTAISITASSATVLTLVAEYEEGDAVHTVVVKLMYNPW